ncbi:MULTISPECIES: energy transducer TonB [Chitinophagaceae]
MKKRKQNIDFDDIVFENRNKDYGAYPLRKGYKRRFGWSLAAAVVFILLLTFLLNKSNRAFLPAPPKLVKTTNVDIRQYQMPKPPEVKPKKIKPKRDVEEELRSQASKVENIPRIMTNRNRHTLTMHPVPLSPVTVDPIEGARLDVQPILKLDTIPKNDAVLAHIEDVTKKMASTKVQSLPHYPGGDSAWYQYLRRNININAVVRNKALPAVYTAVVAFVVHPDSTLSGFRIVQDPGYGTGAEALRVVQRSGKWIPGTKNNKPVSFVQLQTIVFKINN